MAQPELIAANVRAVTVKYLLDVPFRLRIVIGFEEQSRCHRD
jgi:hypothetical protein